MFIVLEGGDGTGKSTQVKKIADVLEGTAYATPPAEFRKKAGEVKRDATPAQQYEFFKSGLIAGSVEISEMLAEDQLVRHVSIPKCTPSTAVMEENSSRPTV